MTVTPGTPPGPLDSKNEPIVFTASKPVVSISVEFNPADGNGPREAVFDGTDVNNAGGSFAYQYRLSTRAGNTWTIAREHGWPAPLRLAVKEAPAAPGPALQPTLYSPLVQWALQGAGETPPRVYNDRSGNGRNLTSGTATATPDLIAGQTAVTNADLRATIAALALNGAMTLTMRVKPSGSTYQALLDVGNTGQTSNYYLGKSAAGALGYSPAYGIGFDTAPIVMPDGVWSFISLRRASANEVTLGVGDQYVTNTVATPGTGSSGIVILGTVEGNSTRWLGAFADLSIWGRRLTDAELDVLRLSAMGGA